MAAKSATKRSKRTTSSGSRSIDELKRRNMQATLQWSAIAVVFVLLLIAVFVFGWGTGDGLIQHSG